MNINVALASPLHDPNGRILKVLAQNGKKLINIYKRKAAVAVSAETIQETINKLKSLGFKVTIQEKETSPDLGINYKLAIKTGLTFGTSHIHLLDFDRALHWANRFPSELSDVLIYMSSYPGFLTFGRTARAFGTHPLVQRTTEVMVNEIASRVAGKALPAGRQEVDIMSGSMGFERKLAEHIVKEAKRRDFGLYAEYLMIALKHKFPIDTIEVEGLEWETPDQFADKIREEGYMKWLEEFGSLPQWERRERLVEESVDVLT